MSVSAAVGTQVERSAEWNNREKWSAPYSGIGRGVVFLPIIWRLPRIKRAPATLEGLLHGNVIPDPPNLIENQPMRSSLKNILCILVPLLACGGLRAQNPFESKFVQYGRCHCVMFSVSVVK